MTCEDSSVPVQSSIVIANEVANWGVSRAKVRQAQDFLRKRGFRFSLSATDYAGHARELAAVAAAQKVDTIIIMGGDGTLNEVISGVLMSGCNHTPRIGIIPAGSSNDFSKSLGIPQRVQEACRVITDGRSRYVDIGRAGPHYFCMASAIGLFAEVAAGSLRMKGFAGSLRYTVPALAVIKKMADGWEMNVSADGRMFHGVYGVLLVGNAPRFGGLTMIPGAQPDDGLLDCLLIEMVSKWEALRLIPLVYRRALDRHRKVTRFRTTSLSVSLDRPTLLCNDGQVCSNTFRHIDYEVLHRRLRVIC